MDGTFAICNRDNASPEKFLRKINQLLLTVKFTIHCLASLDVLVTRRHDNFETSIHRKPASNHLGTTKPEMIRSLQTNMKNSVYKVPCECGETKDTSENRIREQHLQIKKEETIQSGIAELACRKHHKITWKMTTILQKEEHWSRRNFCKPRTLSNNQHLTTEASISTQYGDRFLRLFPSYNLLD